MILSIYLLIFILMVFLKNARLIFLCMQREEGIKLVCEAISSGIFNDLGSGSNVDVCVITKVCSYLAVSSKTFFFLHLAMLLAFSCSAYIFS